MMDIMDNILPAQIGVIICTFPCILQIGRFKMNLLLDAMKKTSIVQLVCCSNAKGKIQQKEISRELLNKRQN